MLSRSAKRRAQSRKNKVRFQRELSFEPLEDRCLLAAVPFGPMQGETPNYFGPDFNWAYSPPWGGVLASHHTVSKRMV
ncbi:MAG: hypothetical protein H8E44_48110 [Planctomycetes bacterium]|nr:hypothetical protein [Planctomycetota bacterium]MBL7037866.1 hypothetical protein [Pirellulaceae bacterium]